MVAETGVGTFGTKQAVRNRTEGERNESLCDPPQPSWKAERSEGVRHLMLGIPGIDAGKLDMLPAEEADRNRNDLANVAAKGLHRATQERNLFARERRSP
jgi:hypothetical protein